MSNVITYVRDDIFKHIPINGRLVILPHVVNSLGGWGAGFSGALSKHYPLTEDTYRYWFAGTDIVGEKDKFALGRSQVAYCLPNLRVVHMACQESYKAAYNRRPLNYEYLYQCMEAVRNLCVKENSTIVTRMNNGWPVDGESVEIHAPKFGSDLAGGDWRIIERMIEVVWVDNGIPVTIYYL